MSSQTRTAVLRVLWPVLAFIAGGALVHFGWIGAYYLDVSDSTECRQDNLRALHRAASAYAEDYGGILPPDLPLSELAGSWSREERFRGSPLIHCDLSGPLGSYIDSDGLLQCGGDPRPIGPDGPRPSYVWNRDLAGRPLSALQPNTPLFRDRAGWHWGRQVNAITCDGRLTGWRHLSAD